MCVRACVRVCVRACVRACVCAREGGYTYLYVCSHMCIVDVAGPNIPACVCFCVLSAG